MRALVHLCVAALVLAVAVPGAYAQEGLEPPTSIGAAQPPASWPQPPRLSADAYVLADLDTGQVLAAGAPDERRPVASTVKVLTALTVLQRADLDRQVTVGPEVDGFAADAAGVGLDAGETWSVEDLLEGLVARSGNDAAAALAVAVGGGTDGFVQAMRRDAAALGVEGATIVEVDGLDDRNRLSARDLLVLTRVAMDDPRFAAVAARPVVELPGLGAVQSRNELLSTYPGADGVKTGYTAASGRCLIASAQRDGRHLVAVVLGSEGPTGHFADARALLDHGFATFTGVPIAGPGPELRIKVAGGWVDLQADPAVTGGDQVSLSAPAGGGQLTRRVDLPDRVATAVTATQEFRWAEVTIGSVPLRGERGASDHTGGAALGAWLVDSAYAAMRAASDEGLWPEGPAGEETAGER